MKPTKPNLRALFEAPEPTAPSPAPAAEAAARPAKKDSHPGKKPVLIHIPEAMHKTLRQVALDEGIPLTQITERLLREFLVRKGYTQHAEK